MVKAIAKMPSFQALDSFREKLLFWLDANGREFPWRKARLSCYRKVVTEVLLQRTKAETVAANFEDFFQAYPSWKRLHAAEESSLAEKLKPMGLWRQRVYSLKGLSAEMVSRGGRFPRGRSELEVCLALGSTLRVLSFYCAIRKK